ncbi:helix-turn-helix domain-containing protein [Lactococcus taiwanensis]|uniref:helix-turn-helix domain-containing protein n=1 Tax=Lactococcus taiwanensis TaxID=1151742 RepID=UPI0019075B77|nr:helix-turn-helix transcriptional regulator [Lactococcus taiwanensis]
MEKNYIFHQRLKEQCRKIKKPIYQVERELNYPRSALNNYRYGKIPSGLRLLELSDYFDVNPEYLLGLSDDPKQTTIAEYFYGLELGKKKELYQLCKEYFDPNLI